jgi:uncharacterized membrane protein HdeD (DUF308 family)
MTTHGVWDSREGHFPPAEAQARLKSAVLARNWWAIALRGVIAIIFGALIFASPGAALLAFVLVFAAYALLDGIFAIIAAVRAARRHDRWGLLVFEGVADLVAAAIAVVLPGATLLAFVFLLAAWALVTGVLAIIAAFQLNLDHGRVWMVLSGLASIVLGVALIIAPLTGAVVLTWWIGAYAIVTGVASIILAIRLYIHRRDADPAHSATPGAAAHA